MNTEVTKQLLIRWDGEPLILLNCRYPDHIPNILTWYADVYGFELHRLRGNWMESIPGPSRVIVIEREAA